ncbi:MAG: type II toxin-antitoxin system VapB family antitoxin [Phycisphaeraceae bacterium]
MTLTAKIFKNGASQAVRLPREFRFETDEVCVKRVGSGILLFSKDAAWDMMAGVIRQSDGKFPARRQTRKQQERKPL